eukprot:761230-Hanusia_phi.AAC.5
MASVVLVTGGARSGKSGERIEGLKQTRGGREKVLMDGRECRQKSMASAEEFADLPAGYGQKFCERICGQPVYVATAQQWDKDMKQRISRYFPWIVAPLVYPLTS